MEEASAQLIERKRNEKINLIIYTEEWCGFMNL